MLKVAGVDSLLREEIFRLVSFVWKNGVCPKSWGSALIIPLLKKGDPSVMNNYRGIALQDIVEKVFATILVCHLHYQKNYGVL